MTPPAIAALRADTQGNVLEAYGQDYGYVHHLVVTVGDAAEARTALRSMVDHAPGPVKIASGADSTGPFVNLGITWLGLEALGVPSSSLRTFPPEFRAGMVARAARLGDIGPSGPDFWVGGLGAPAIVHLIFTVHATSREAVRDKSDQVLAAGQAGAWRRLSCFEGHALLHPDSNKRVEHFGFRDGLSQPRFEGIGRRPPAPTEPIEPLGVVLLGHPTSTPHVAVRVPEPSPLGHQGSFSAFRVLGQDVAAFRDFVARTAAERGLSTELVMAKLCGRWPNGVPLAVARTAEDAEAYLASGRALNDFDLSDDQDGRLCPVGSHVRRANPRRAHIVQRPANRTRRLVRRGMPFGDWLESDAPPDGPRRRGLLGNFLCASLSTQFEAMQYDWINLGLQDPGITGTNDPLVGTNDPRTSSFTFWTLEHQWLTLTGISSFTETMGGAYCFVPSMPALRWIASLDRGR